MENRLHVKRGRSLWCAQSETILVVGRKTNAGKKFEREFLPLLVESAKAAEQLLKIAVTKIEAH